MTDKELQLSIIKRALLRGGEYADIFTEHRRHTSLVLEDGKLEKMATGTEAGSGIRLITGGKTAYAFSNDMSARALMEAASEVSKAASGTIAPPVADLTISRPSVKFPEAPLPGTVSVEQKIALVRHADAAARSLDNRIKQVTVIYRDSLQQVRIATSEGSLAEDNRFYTTMVIQVVAVADGIIQTAYESAGGLIGFDLFDAEAPEMLSLKAARRALMMLRAGKAPGGRMPVVISSQAG